MSHVTKTAGIEVFYDPKKWEHSRRKIRIDPRALLN